ncbi:MAG: HAD family hydrolase [Coriobacteriales bacterium]|nr:HAD family hydrolase [Coriobacteriales bacterium]
MIKLVLSDVDGTLIPLGKGKVSKYAMDAIAAVKEAGVEFGLATGRDVVELNGLFEGDTRAFETGILSNGKKIFVDGKLERLMLLNNEALKRALAVVREYPNTFMTAYPLNTNESNPIYCMGAPKEEVEAWGRTYSFSAIMASDVPDEEIIGSTIATNAPEQMLDEMCQRVLEACPEFDIAKPAARWWDILPKGVNKGTALQYLLDDLGIRADEAVMFGDADNDLAILRRLENAVTVAEATPAAFAASKYHIGRCEDEAVADALLDIAQASREGRMPRFMTKP